MRAYHFAIVSCAVCVACLFLLVQFAEASKKKDKSGGGIIDAFKKLGEKVGKKTITPQNQTPKKGLTIKDGTRKKKGAWSNLGGSSKRKWPLIGKPIPRWEITWWTNFYSNYTLTYKKENRSNFEVFQNNVEEVYRHNNEYDAGNKTWWKGINVFTDMTEEELRTYTSYNGGIISRHLDRPPNVSRVRRSTDDLPKSLNYRESGMISPVKDQGICGSCFAFAVAACMESKYAMEGENVTLSEQHIVECSRSYGNKACGGGSFKITLEFATRVGVDTGENYPYNETDTRECRAGQSEYDHRIINSTLIEQDESAMMRALLENGPIVSSVVVDREFFSYEGGVFMAPNDTSPNHAILVAGYGNGNETDVWYLKNSWGEDWGQGGFMNIQRNIRGIVDEAFAIVSVESRGSQNVESTAPQSGQTLWVDILALCLPTMVYYFNP